MEIFSRKYESSSQVHLAWKQTEVKNEELHEKVKNLRWKDQELEFPVETLQRLKKEGVKNVNNVAARTSPNRIEAATQIIRTKQEYKQTGKRVRQKECLQH